MSNHPNFEAIKVALKQDKTGFVLTLCIHPDDLDDRILRDFVGARYQVVMVRIDDQGQPFTRPTKPKAVATAGLLCRNPSFRAWLRELGEILDDTEASAVSAIHRIIGIRSRSELSDPAKAEEFDQMVKEFNAWVRETGAPPF